jgi:hypothetical protein
MTPPLAYRVRRLRTRPKPTILVQVGPRGFLRGFQVCDVWNLASLQPGPIGNVQTLRNNFPDFAFVLVPTARTPISPPEQWEAIGNPSALVFAY